MRVVVLTVEVATGPPVTMIEEVKLPSSVSVAVAPGSMNVPPTDMVVVASPMRVIVGGVFAGGMTDPPGAHDPIESLYNRPAGFCGKTAVGWAKLVTVKVSVFKPTMNHEELTEYVCCVPAV